MSATDSAVNGAAGLVEDQPSLGGLAGAELPKFAEDLPALLNVAFVEQFGGWVRIDERAADGGQQWHEPTGEEGAFGPATPIEGLPPVGGTVFALTEWLDKYCASLTAGAGKPIIWTLQRTARTNSEGDAMYVCGIHIVNSADSQERPTTFAKGASNDPAVAIATAMLSARDVGPQQLAVMHRDLFAHRYLVG